MRNVGGKALVRSGVVSFGEPVSFGVADISLEEGVAWMEDELGVFTGRLGGGGSIS